eukprot:8731863-Pyramimonas_sp.AAC.1
MANADGQMGMRADEDTFLNVPTSPASGPCAYNEYPTAWIFEKNPITEEEARGYMNVFTSLSRNDWVLEQRRRRGMCGTTLSEVPGLFGGRHELALAANSGTMVDGMLAILLDILSSSLVKQTAHMFEQVSRSHGHATKKLNLTKRLYVSGVGLGAA